MLTGSEVNPFDSQETKPWVKLHPTTKQCAHTSGIDIVTRMTHKSKLWPISSMPIKDVKSILLRRFWEVRTHPRPLWLIANASQTDNRSTIMDDNFIRSYIGDLLRSLRTYYLIDLIKPYTRLELSFLAKVLHYFFPLNSSIKRFAHSNWMSRYKKSRTSL